MTREEAIAIFKERLVIAETYADCDLGGYDEAMRMAIKALEQEPKSEWQKDNEILKAYSDGANGVLDKLRAEIEKYGSIWVAYAITDETKTSKGIEKLVSDVLKQAKEQMLNVIDKYKRESEELK